jgi:thiamine biosynthesis lipoprotein
MVQTQLIMGMPITVEIVDAESGRALEDVFEYFRAVDRRYSTYKNDSEISRINAGLPQAEWSEEMRHVLELCEQTKQETNGFFDIMHGGRRDPSGLVKGWAIEQAAGQLRGRGFANFYIDAGGDIQVGGRNAEGGAWKVGIRNPFNREETVKRVAVTSEGVATSGTYIRGQHIYNPHSGIELSDIQSLTVIGSNIYEADRFATAAFAMGREGIAFIESRPGLEGYMIDGTKTATFTSDFERYVI